MRRFVTHRYAVPLGVFFGAIVFFGLTWRLSFVITDNWTIANTLLAVADGHLHFTDIVYGPDSGGAPGAHLVDGRIYGRNYGQVFLALPVLWVLHVTTELISVTLLLPAVWSVAVFGFVASLGLVADRTRLGVSGGTILGVSAFAVNATLVGTVEGPALPLVALQSVTVVAAALIAVVISLLVSAIHGRRVGVTAGAAVVLATPVTFWATIPKRHSLTAFFAVLTLYLFYRSRAAQNVTSATRFRALAYVPVGLTTWVHAPEGLVLFVALAAVDLPTARSNRPRHLAIVGTVFFLSMVPFFATNTVIAGNPLEPPRALPPFEGELPRSEDPGGTGQDGVGGGFLVTVLVTGFEQATVFVRYLANSAGTAGQPGRLFDVFVRSGHGLGLHRLGVQSVNLSVLESMPIAGALLVAPLLLYRRVRDGRVAIPKSVQPERATDVLAIIYLVLLVVIYVPRLPLHVTFTVRYLHPLFPLCVYFLARFEMVRRVIHTRLRVLGGSYAAFVIVGGPLFVLFLVAIADTQGAAVQLNARLALAGAAVLVYWAVITTVYGGYERLGAVSFGFASATTTVFLVLSAIGYFRYGAEFALPVVREVADVLVLFP